MTNSTIPARLTLTLLGGFDARLDGRPLPAIAYNRMRALLAYLAVEREQDHPRDKLAELLWPENDAATGRGNLRRTLSELRQALGGPPGTDLLRATKETIRLAGGFSLDVRDFSGQLALADEEAAIALYRGEFLAGLTFAESPVFEEWVRAQRETLHGHALGLLERLWRRHLQDGQPAKALPFALKHVALEPWDEDVHRQVMLLRAQNGQKAAALEQYETCRRHLAAELAREPGLDTEHLAQRIRSGEWDGVPTQRASQPAATAPSPAERRPVTVLYCELTPAGSDDPDEAMALLTPAQMRCARIIERFSGYVAPSQGGGMLAYFGYPKADERAARHAVQAALAIARAAEPGVEIRVGIHSGPVITGGHADLPDAVGRTSKLAARLHHDAATSPVAISLQTRDLVAGYFECTSLGARRITGLSQPLEIFGVERETGARTRLEAMTPLTPLAGRKPEIDRLLHSWRKAVAGAHECVLLRGEAGIGKTRLLRALMDRLQEHPAREMRCYPETTQSPFQPLITLLETELDFLAEFQPVEKFTKLAAHFERQLPAAATAAVPLLAQLLSLPLGGGYQAARGSPQKQKEQTIEVLLDWLLKGQRQPALLIVEDLHWADPSTLELLAKFVARHDGAPLLTVFSTRPDFVVPWKLPTRALLDLPPLDRHDAARMVASVGVRVPAMVERIVARCDGIPLFIEEMTRLAATDTQADIPPTLHDLLAARIDRLGEAKHVAQVAATLGREFELDLLRLVFPGDADALAAGLAALGDTGLTTEIGASTWQFKHALIQEAAYQSQTRAGRQASHMRAAQVLIAEFPDIAATRPELLAHHLSLGGQRAPAIDFWIKAGQRASGHSALSEAMAHFESGLRELAELPASRGRDAMEFGILVLLCPVLYAVLGYGSRQATEANRRLALLSEQVGDSPDLFMAKWALVMNTIANAGSRGVPARARELLAMTKGDPLKQQAAHYAIADAAFWLGDFATAQEQARSALALYRPAQHGDMLASFGEDLSVSCGAYLAWSEYFLGFAERARATSGSMLARARELNHPHTLGLALCFASVLHRWLDDVEQALLLSDETIDVSRQQGFSVWLAAGEMVRGWAMARKGDKEGAALCQSGVDGMRAAVGGISVVFLSALAEAHVHLKQHPEALEVLAQARNEVERTGDGHFTAELHRLEGVCLLARSGKNAAKAKTCFETALQISRAQGAKALELRAAASLARRA